MRRADITGRARPSRETRTDVFNFNFPTYCLGTPELDNVTYEAARQRRWPPRRQGTRRRRRASAMSDEPPTPTEIKQMNAGGTVTAGVTPDGTRTTTA